MRTDEKNGNTQRDGVASTLLEIREVTQFNYEPVTIHIYTTTISEEIHYTYIVLRAASSGNMDNSR